VKEVFPDAKHIPARGLPEEREIKVAEEVLSAHAAQLSSDVTKALATLAVSPRNIFQRMHAVMQDVKGVAKDSYNPHGKYKYQGHTAVTAALREAYVKHGIVRCADIDKVEREGGLLRLYVRVTWINIDNPSDRHIVETLGESAKMTSSGEASPVQAGVALSYAVKIAELKAFSLTDDDTPDADEESEGSGSRQQPAPKSQPRGEPKGPPPSPTAVTGLLVRYDAIASQAELEAHRTVVGNVLDTVTAEDYKKLENADAAAVARLSKKG
jgi:hypothetical protein